MLHAILIALHVLFSIGALVWLIVLPGRPRIQWSRQRAGAGWRGRSLPGIVPAAPRRAYRPHLHGGQRADKASHENALAGASDRDGDTSVLQQRRALAVPLPDAGPSPAWRIPATVLPIGSDRSRLARPRVSPGPPG